MTDPKKKPEQAAQVILLAGASRIRIRICRIREAGRSDSRVRRIPGIAQPC